MIKKRGVLLASGGGGSYETPLGPDYSKHCHTCGHHQRRETMLEQGNCAGIWNITANSQSVNLNDTIPQIKILLTIRTQTLRFDRRSFCFCFCINPLQQGPLEKRTDVCAEECNFGLAQTRISCFTLLVVAAGCEPSHPSEASELGGGDVYIQPPNSRPTTRSSGRADQG